MKLRTEVHLWDHIRPRLRRGRRWTRLESRGTTRGPGDAFGFYGNQTHWIELKIGKPGVDKLRSSQVEFIDDCIKENIPAWCCFAHNGVVRWFCYMDFDNEVSPPFYDSKIPRVVFLSRLRRHR